MIITLFNGLSGLQVRGISKVADELALHLRKSGHTVHEVKIPKILYIRNTLARVLLLIIYQQFVCPIVALRTRSRLIVDPYNGYPLLATFFVRTKYFIHDYTPFKRSYWYLRPGTIYQFLLFKLDSLFSLAEMYHDSLDIDTPTYLRRLKAPKVFPCIVDPLNTSGSTFFEKNIQPVLAKSDKNLLLVSTISGNGWNKDFGGLVNLLRSLDRPFLLVAFGFGEQDVKYEQTIAEDGSRSHVFTVGFVDESAISSMILKSHLFVFHSLSEGFGRPILEALQLGKLLVTADAPVLNILSEEALKNIFRYKDSREFNLGVNQALSSEFVSFSRTYKEGIDQGFDQFLK